MLVEKSLAACRQFHVNRLAVGGGVTCNSSLRERLQLACREHDITLLFKRATLLHRQRGDDRLAGLSSVSPRQTFLAYADSRGVDTTPAPVKLYGFTAVAYLYLRGP